MSTPAYDTKVRPSALWYLLVTVLWIASFIVFILAFKPIYDILSSGITEVANGQQIAVPDGGLTVYITDEVSAATCALTDGQGNATALEPFGEGENFDFDPSNGPHVYALGSTPDNLSAGTYALTCVRLQGATLATGDRVDFGDIGKRIGLGFLGAGVLGLIGLVVLIVMLVKRHKSKSRIRQLEASAAYGSYPASYGGYGAPPQAGSYPSPGSYPPPAGYPPSSPPPPTFPGTDGETTQPPTYPGIDGEAQPPTYPGTESRPGDTPPTYPGTESRPGDTPPTYPPTYPPPDDGSASAPEENPPRS